MHFLSLLGESFEPEKEKKLRKPQPLGEQILGTGSTRAVVQWGGGRLHPERISHIYNLVPVYYGVQGTHSSVSSATNLEISL